MIYSNALEDRLVALNSEVVHLGYLLDALLQPTATESDHQRVAPKVSKDLARITSELHSLEAIAGGRHQSLIDSLVQTVLNLSLFTKVALHVHQ